ncbi:hypothetical protein RclHR1_25300001 [Rhizophagus clarus]|nr:hypothetical protein RclHR1_25300001 [Rhizophagus clarus]
MDIDISSPAQHQSNPVTPLTHAELTPKGKGKKKNKNKNNPTVDLNFAGSWDKKPAQTASSSTQPLPRLRTLLTTWRYPSQHLYQICMT